MTRTSSDPVEAANWPPRSGPHTSSGRRADRRGCRGRDRCSSGGPGRARCRVRRPQDPGRAVEGPEPAPLEHKAARVADLIGELQVCQDDIASRAAGYRSGIVSFQPAAPPVSSSGARRAAARAARRRRRADRGPRLGLIGSGRIAAWRPRATPEPSSGSRCSARRRSEFDAAWSAGRRVAANGRIRWLLTPTTSCWRTGSHPVLEGRGQGRRRGQRRAG